MCARRYLRMVLRANYLLLHVETLYKQRPKEHKGVGSVRAFFELFIYFQGCQPLLFKDLTLALQSNTRTEGGKIKKKNTHTHALLVN